MPNTAENESSMLVWGENNLITVIDNGVERELDGSIRGLKISINGDNNRVRIGLPQKFNDCNLLIMGDNNVFSIRPTNSKIDKAFFLLSDGCGIKIGKNCTFQSNVSIFAKEKKGLRVVIGENCAISSECIFRTGDGHTIIDSDTKEPLNEPESIFIGNHVWVGYRSMILKGTQISANSIVGAMSLVNGIFDEENILIAGSPARIVKHDISWSISNWNEYDKNREDDEFFEAEYI